MVFVLRVLRYCGSVSPVTASSLMHATADNIGSSVVDVYNVATGAWSTAQLSGIPSAAASVENLALFAGSALLYREGGDRVFFVACVVCVLLVVQYCGCLPCDRFLSHARHCSLLSF